MTSNAMSTAKYSRPGELFGKMSLKGNLSEDTTSGRLILTNCSSLLLRKSGTGSTDTGSATKNGNVVYVTGIEDSGKATLYLRLSSRLVQDFDLKRDKELEVEVQFQLNRLPLVEMHHAVDQLPDMSLVRNSDVFSSLKWTLKSRKVCI